MSKPYRFEVRWEEVSRNAPVRECWEDFTVRKVAVALLRFVLKAREDRGTIRKHGIVCNVRFVEVY